MTATHPALITRSETVRVGPQLTERYLSSEPGKARCEVYTSGADRKPRTTVINVELRVDGTGDIIARKIETGGLGPSVVIPRALFDLFVERLNQ